MTEPRRSSPDRKPRPKPREEPHPRRAETAAPGAGKGEPGARISRRAAERLRAGQVWVYASDVEAVETGEGEAPFLLPVADSRGLLLGTALFSPASQIVLRLV